MQEQLPRSGSFADAPFDNARLGAIQASAEYSKTNENEFDVNRIYPAFLALIAAP